MMLMPQMMPTGPNGLKMVAGQDGDPEWGQISYTGYGVDYVGSLNPTTGGAIAPTVVVEFAHFLERMFVGGSVNYSVFFFSLSGPSSPPPNSGWTSVKIYDAAGELITTKNRADAGYSTSGNLAYFDWYDAIPTATGPFVNGQTYFLEFI